MSTLRRARLLLLLRRSEAIVLLGGSLRKGLMLHLRQHRPVFQVADDVGAAVGRHVAQGIDLHRLRLHLRHSLLLFGEVRVQPLEVERRGEEVALDALAVLRHRLRLLLEEVQSLSLVLRDEWQGVQLLPPLVRDLDGVGAVAVLLYRHALRVGVLDEPLHVLRLQRVEHVPEVLALGQPAVGRGVRHVQHEGLVALHERPELLHRELVVPRHADLDDLAELEQFLVLHQQLFHEISVEHLLRRDVELQLVLHVGHEVFLRLEPRKQLLRHDAALLGAHERLLLLLLLVLLHLHLLQLLLSLHLLLLLLIIH